MNAPFPDENCAKSSRFAALSGIVALVLVALLSSLFPSELASGTVYFTGLDDSAQCALTRSFAKDAPLVFHDDAFKSVPRKVRSALLYRPAAARKTHDLAHQINRRTFAARPFFQPFLPWQRARLPGLPVILALCTALLIAAFALRGAGYPRRPLVSLAWSGILLVCGSALIPWLWHFPLGPYAEGPATLFAMLALALAFYCGRPQKPSGALEGLCLGLAATFHPTLAVYAVPIGVFSILRRGAWRHTLALLLGVVLGLVPLVLSTIYVTAPYGNFLDPAAFRKMLRRSGDIRAIVLALAAALPLGVAALALAHAPRLRAVFSRSRIRAIVAFASALAIVLALVMSRLHPAAHRALATDSGDILLAIPHLAVAIALALAWRRPATCALVAGCALAALPFFVIQGQEVHVGIWSLRRALPPFAILTLAALLGAFETDAEEGADPLRFRCRAALRRWWVWLLVPVAVLQAHRTSPWGTVGERGATALVDAIDTRLQAGALYLFERIPETAPFASIPRREVFGLNDRLSNALDHDNVVRWLRREAAKRPVYVVALRDVAAPIPDKGIVLVPEGEPIRGEIRRAYGKTFREARETTTTRVFSFLRVWPSDSPEGRAALAGGVALAPGAASPFGLVPGAWDVPRRGHDGRWASDGAAFWGPVPGPGETIRFRLSASWWTRDGTNTPPQTLRLEPPFAGESIPATLQPSFDPQEVVLAVTRNANADNASPSGLGLYRIRGAETYDERGFPPALIAEIRAIAQ